VSGIMGWKPEKLAGTPGLVNTKSRSDAHKGVMHMNIEHMNSDLERMAGMTAEDRALRKQWIMDQYLTDREPVRVPNLVYRNSVKRFFGYPLDMVGKAVMPYVGPRAALVGRYLAGKFGLLVGFYACCAYYFRHNQKTWEQSNLGWTFWFARKPVYPGDPDWGCVEQTDPWTWESNHYWQYRTVFTDPSCFQTSTETSGEISRREGGYGPFLGKIKELKGYWPIVNNQDTYPYGAGQK